MRRPAGACGSRDIGADATPLAEYASFAKIPAIGALAFTKAPRPRPRGEVDS